MMRKILLLVAVAAIACQAAPTPEEALMEKLYNNVIVGDYEGAVADTKNLAGSGNEELISAVVKRLIDENQRNLMPYAYNVYLDSADIVKDIFPLQFRMIFEGNHVKIISKKDNLAIKVSIKVDSDGDRTAYGDKDDKTSERVAWQFKPLLENQRVYFKIMSVQRGEYLKTGKSADRDGDHAVYSSHNSDTNRHQWYLNPVYYEGELLFYITNREFDQAMKLGRSVDSYGDRQVYTNNGDVIGKPEDFGWAIKPF